MRSSIARAATKGMNSRILSCRVQRRDLAMEDYSRAFSLSQPTCIIGK